MQGVRGVNGVLPSPGSKVHEIQSPTVLKQFVLSLRPRATYEQLPLGYDITGRLQIYSQIRTLFLKAPHTGLSSSAVQPPV